MAAVYAGLGFDPCPGDLPGYQALANYAQQAAMMVTGAEQVLASAGSAGWRGQAADAFRQHVDQDVHPLTQKAAASVERAALALRWWAITLEGLQQEAQALDQQAQSHRDELDMTLSLAGLPAGSSPPWPAKATCRPEGPAGHGDWRTGRDHYAGE
jgi:hypothetical protein